jgi:hypothetical protein
VAKKLLISVLAFITIWVQSSLDGIAQEQIIRRTPTTPLKTWNGTLPKGFFLNNQIGIGLTVNYSLTFKHSAKQQVLFPDQNFDFSPFELVNKQHFPTKTNKNISIDSAVYQLTTFEIQKVQTLALPVFVVNPADCTWVYSLADSVELVEMVRTVPDSLIFKTDQSVIRLTPQFNYPLYIFLLAAIILIIGLLWLILGAKLLRNYRFYQNSQRHAKFTKEFGRLLTRIRIKPSAEDIEKALILWKNHLEYLDQIPYSTYTSKEIHQIVSDNVLTDALKSIDKTIYGQEFSDHIEVDMVVLSNFVSQRFELRQKTILGV